MSRHVSGTLLALIVGIGAVTRADDPAPAGLDREPVLRVNAGGPTAYVTSLAFRDDQTLYAGGLDKLLHVWALNKDKQFVPGNNGFRVPIGPGIDGAINAAAVSPDGTYIALGGRGLMRGVAGFRHSGIWVPTLRAVSAPMWQDQGTIHVFDTRTGNVQLLRGHRGQVSALAFAPARKGKPPLLVSAAREYQEPKFTGVVRLWDVSKGTEVDQVADLPDLTASDRVRWARLAVEHTGDGVKQVRVALGWDDGSFRLWNVDRADDRVVTKLDGDFNSTVAFLTEADRVLTGSVRAGKGVLTRWNAAGGKCVELDSPVALAGGGRPRDLALFASRTGGEPDRVAVVVEAAGDTKDTSNYTLAILDLATFKPVRPAVKLWPGPVLLMPSLAISPGSRFLAVAGNREHTVAVFAIGDLLGKKEEVEPKQLRGVGAMFGSVAFVDSAKSTGILLSKDRPKAPGQPRRDPQEGDLIFDLGRRSLTSDVAGWERAKVPAAGWSVTASFKAEKDERPRVRLAIWDGDQKTATVELRPGQFVTDYQLLPPRAALPVPLLAVAYVELGRPMLTVYHGKTAEPLRQFTGHAQTIHALAFSANGRLLASTAADQTVCVWSLDGLERVVNRMGTLPGLAVAEQKGGLVLAEIDPASLSPANAAAIRNAGCVEGDAVEGLVDAKAKLVPVATGVEFYNRIGAVKPGDPVTLRIRKRDVPLRVGQGADEHKPLFSLFVARDGKAWRWLGWSPVGPYDASDRDAERLLGWHKNTGDPKKPVSYALANEYREVNYKPDILRYLAAQGSTGQAIEEWKKDHPEKLREPQMTLWIKELGLQPPLDARGRLLVGKPQVTVQLAVNDLPSDRIKGVRWQRSATESGAFELSPDMEWTADLSKLPWKRGEYKVRVILQTLGQEGADYPRELVLQYQPARPAVRATGEQPRVVDKADYRVQAEVAPGDGQVVRVSVAHRHKDKDLLNDKPSEAKELTKIDRTLKLEPGLNQIKVLAHNRDAMPDDDAEADWLTLDVLYKTAQPQVTLTTVTAADGLPIRLNPDKADKPIVVSSPRVLVRGEIEALDKIAAAAWDDGAKRHPLAAGKTKLAIDQEVTLTKAGQPRKFRFLARTESSEETERVVVLEYQPILPELRVTAPVNGQPLYEGEHKRLVELKGLWQWPGDAHACTATVLVNGKEQDKPADVTARAASFAAMANLQPGENWVQVRIKNAWRETTTPKVLVSYRRPPRITSLAGPKLVEKPFVAVAALVASPKSLPLTRVRVQGNELAAELLKPEVVEQDGDATIYRISMRELPLKRGKNVIELLAGNADGWSLKPAVLEVEYKSAEKAPPRADAALINPGQDGVVEAPEYAVEFRVRSTSPLTKVEVERNGMKVAEAAGLADLKKNSDGIFELKQTRKVALEPGPNSLKIIAHNAGGEAVSQAVVLTYQFEPVRVVIDHIQAEGKDVAPALVVGDGKLVFPSVAQDRVWLHGHVEWGPSGDAPMAKVAQVRVSLNGCQQLPVALEPRVGDGRMRKFKTELRLSRAQGNHATVKVPGVMQEEGSRHQCLLDTSAESVKTEPRRQVHLLIVDTSASDEQKARAQVLDALQATVAGENRFTKPGFADGGRLYGPLVGAEVTPERVFVQLLSIKRNLRLRAAAGAVNDVVFVYFRGGEAVEMQGHFLQTRVRRADPELRWSGIPCESLTRFCTDNLGTQIVLLDVTRDAPSPSGSVQDRVIRWPEDPSVAVWRYAWVGSALEQTDGARLLTNWGTALGQAKSLGEVARLVEGKFVRGPLPWPSQSYPGKLTGVQHLPPSMEAVPVGKP
ncbi:MAG: hypothetical protein K2R98_28170 [Gemmataceae bacterium]|nr:hypothetical protein [Gemmataceae bacterium]